MTTIKNVIRIRTATRPVTQTGGFSRIDALAVTGACCVLFLLILPALARPGMNVKGIQCLNNTRQLTRAWQLYADDSQDRIVYASTGGPGSGGNPINPNDYAWSGVHMDFDGAGNRGNWDVNFDIVKRPLWPYAGQDVSIYKCPEDQSSVNAFGTIRPRVLSMTMNLYLGGFAPVAGGLEGNTGGWPFAAAYRVFSKTAQLAPITPAKTFVFMDARPDQVNWSNFMVDMSGDSPADPTQYSFADIPGFLHDNAAAFSFADGSGELHRWQDARTTPALSPNGVIISYNLASPNNPDVTWLQDHATRLK